ncbi:MAG: hypothetical protein LUF34_08945 [Lachnospiraceae bacterium]|nr:hypothetical protein [Lachnospiraceae bacterium]
MRILKVLGILLLILLGVILVLLLLILFCPICYEAAGRAEKPDYQVRGKIRLFLVIVRLRALVDEKGFRYSLKLFGLRMKHGGRKRESADREKFVTKEKTSEEREVEPATSALEYKQSGEEPEEKTKGADEVNEACKAEGTRPDQGSSRDAQNESRTTQTADRKAREEARRTEQRGASPPGESGRAKKKRRSPKQKKSSTKTTGKSSPPDKARGIASSIRHVWEELHDPTNRRMFNLVKNQVFRILRHVRPRKLRLRGVIGTGDPAQTGWILGIFYMLYPLYGSAGEFELAGDFENQTLQGRFYLAGHIVPAVPLSAGIRLLLDRDIRHFVRKTFF